LRGGWAMHGGGAARLRRKIDMGGGPHRRVQHGARNLAYWALAQLKNPDPLPARKLQAHNARNTKK
jgi:hypothetical protein